MAKLTPVAVASIGQDDVVAQRNGAKRRLKAVAAPEPKAKAKAKAAVKAPPRYRASFYPGDQQPLPPKFSAAVKELERVLKADVWMLIQNSSLGGSWSILGPDVVRAFMIARSQMPKGKPVALLIDSPGGYAKSAWQIAMILRTRCGGFTAVIPRYAKSAATILTCGADTILMGEHAELGPLDAQYFDNDRESVGSALDEVQTLERLHAVSLELVDRTMNLLLGSSGKKIETLLPISMNFIGHLMRPMLEKIDAVHYTQMSRILKVAEDYAIRLLRAQYSLDEARTMARHLVEHYPEHDFAVDAIEAASFGLRTKEPTDAEQRIFDEMAPFWRQITAIGRLEEVRGHGK